MRKTLVRKHGRIFDQYRRKSNCRRLKKLRGAQKNKGGRPQNIKQMELKPPLIVRRSGGYYIHTFLTI